MTLRRFDARRIPLGAAMLAALVVAASGCGGGGSDAAATTTAAKAPAGCGADAGSIQVGVGEGAAPAAFDVAQAAAQRVAMIPGEMAFDASEMAGLASKAAVSPLGQYTVYVTDGEIDTSSLSEDDKGTVADGSSTVAAIRIIPAAEGGFVEGEVVAPSTELQYETRSEQVPVSAAILPEGSDDALELTDDLTGTVTVLSVDDDAICLDVDLTVAGAEGGRIDGVVEAPVTRAGNSFFVT